MTAADIISGSALWSIEKADCLSWLKSLPDDSLDLIFTSPPYEKARLYLEGKDRKNLGIARKTEDWVAWLVEVFRECSRVCKGLVAFVVEGQTKNYRYSAGPLLLAADLHRAGFNLRKPPIFARVGIPGSGGPDWLRNDWEFIICTTRPGRLPWSDPTACGHPPKWAPGGEMSSRLSNGARVNQWGRVGSVSTNSRGEKPTSTRGMHRPSHKMLSKESIALGASEDPTLIDFLERPQGIATCGAVNGDVESKKGYDPPAVANPGNIVRCIVGGGNMGSDKASLNEAPFPQALAEFFVRSFCPPGGIVGEPFAGSGTTLAAALKWGRRAVGCDLRQSMVNLTTRRVQEEATGLFDHI